MSTLLASRAPILRWSVLVVVFLSGFLTARLWLPRAAPAAAQVAPAGNGDVNGDGQIDVSDAVGLINYLFLAGPPPVVAGCPPIVATTAVVVRHAEKETAGADPCLTPEGQVRATRLRDALSRLERIDAVIATGYCRTTQTLEPLASQRGKVIQSVSHDDEVPQIVSLLHALPPGNLAVVAGNSFNIPTLVKALGVDVKVTVPGDEFDNIWVIQFGPPGAMTSTLTHLRY